MKMSINDLPNDCLMTIFAQLRFFEDLVQASQVCVRWNDLVTSRFARVKYLLSDSAYSSRGEHVPVLFWRNRAYISKDERNREKLRQKPKGNTLFIRESVEEFKLHKLLPNLRIFDTNDYDNVDEVLKDNPTVKGIIHYDSKFPSNIGNVEMIAMKTVVCYYDELHCDNLTQLRLYECNASWLIKNLELFANLSRLHIHCIRRTVALDRLLQIPLNNNLKILEIPFSIKALGFPLNRFLDSFTSLESAFLHNYSNNLKADTKVKNFNLRDLVIDENYWSDECHQSWTSLRRLLSKFPNLKHLAIRGNDKVNDDNITQLVRILPKIELLDFRQSKNVTKKSAEFLDEYCKKSGRSIVIYYSIQIRRNLVIEPFEDFQLIDLLKSVDGDEPSDWPKLGSSKDVICSGFDFMRNCFFKYFDQLPYFLDQ